MAGLQFGKGRMTIDSVVWAQYINVTDTQTATAVAALTHCVRAAKLRYLRTVVHVTIGTVGSI